MSLSAEQFQQIIASLKSDDRDLDKRTAPRVGFRAKLTIYLDANETRPADVWLRDLSANGIGVVYAAPLEAGQEFMVKYPVRGERPLVVVYTVMHCKELNGRVYFIGSRLSRTLDR